MSSPIPYLNLDDSFPVEDDFHNHNESGTIRFISAADQRHLVALQRLQGDLVHRFLLNEGAINALIQVLNDQPQLASFDNANYVLADGTHPFTVPVNSPDPLTQDHLANRRYVDSADARITALLDSLSDQFRTLQLSLPKYTWSPWTEYTWSAGHKVVVDLPLVPAVVNLERLIGLSLLERLNVGTLEAPVYKYRQLFHGSLGGTSGAGSPGQPAGDGMHVDDCWLQSNSIMRVLLPNTSSYPTGYPAQADYNLVSPVQRFLRAVVWEYQQNAVPQVTSASDVLYLALQLDGLDDADKVFGGWRPARDVNILGLQLALQDTVANNVVIELANVDGVGLGDGFRATITTGAKFQETIFATPYLLQRGSVLKFKQLGLPAEVGTAHLSVTTIYRPV